MAAKSLPHPAGQTLVSPGTEVEAVAGQGPAQARPTAAAHPGEAYLDLAGALLAQVEETLADLGREAPALKLIEIKGFMQHAQRQIDQIRRRVIQGETIAHGEKVFSIFEPHTEWISKGKAGVPVELGLRVCVLEDQYGFVLHHHRKTDR